MLPGAPRRAFSSDILLMSMGYLEKVSQAVSIIMHTWKRGFSYQLMWSYQRGHFLLTRQQCYSCFKVPVSFKDEQQKREMHVFIGRGRGLRYVGYIKLYLNLEFAIKRPGLDIRCTFKIRPQYVLIRDPEFFCFLSRNNTYQEVALNIVFLLWIWTKQT